MTVRNRPNYQLYLISLTNAGTQDIPAIGTRIAMAGAYLGASVVSIAGGYQEIQGGAPTLATVNVQLGKTPGDPIPFSVGSAVRVDNKFDFVRLSWGAQANVTVVILVSDDADGNGVEITASPTIAAGNVAIVEGGNTAVVNATGQLQVEIIGVGGGFGAIVSSDGTQGVRQLGGPLGSAVLLTNPALNSIPTSSGGTQQQPGGSAEAITKMPRSGQRPSPSLPWRATRTALLFARQAFPALPASAFFAPARRPHRRSPPTRFFCLGTTGLSSCSRARFCLRPGRASMRLRAPERRATST